MLTVEGIGEEFGEWLCGFECCDSIGGWGGRGMVRVSRGNFG